MRRGDASRLRRFKGDGRAHFLSCYRTARQSCRFLSVPRDYALQLAICKFRRERLGRFAHDHSRSTANQFAEVTDT